MGIVYSKILLKNPRLPHLAVEVDALADTGSLYLCIPEHIRAKLQLDVIGEKELLLADSSVRKLPYAGPIELRFKNRVAFTGAVVLGDEVLIRRKSREPGYRESDPEAKQNYLLSTEFRGCAVAAPPRRRARPQALPRR